MSSYHPDIFLHHFSEDYFFYFLVLFLPFPVVHAFVFLGLFLILKVHIFQLFLQKRVMRYTFFVCLYVWKYLYLTLMFDDILAGYRIISWVLFSFWILKAFFYHPDPSVAIKKSRIVLNPNLSFFCLETYRIFLSWVLNFTMIDLYLDLSSHYIGYFVSFFSSTANVLGYFVVHFLPSVFLDNESLELIVWFITFLFFIFFCF